jgi:hypothetical protein
MTSRAASPWRKSVSSPAQPLKRPRPIVAWKVSAGEHAWVVFSHHFFEARRLGAERLELAWDEVTCERAPALDRYAATGMAVSDYLREGWWWTCSYCEHHVDEDGCSRCDADADDDSGPMPPPVVDDVGEHVWCSEACREAERTERDESKARESRLTAETRRRWPGATNIRVWLNCIEFSFPGGTGPAQWMHPERPLEVVVRRCDLAAWFEFAGHARAA